MKLVKIKRGPFKGRIGKVLKTEGDEVTVAIEGEDKPVKIKIDWIKVLNFVSTLLSVILSFVKKG